MRAPIRIAAERLASGDKVRVADVQALIQNHIPSLIVDSIKNTLGEGDHRLSYRAQQLVRLVTYGGKKRLKDVSSEGEISIQGLLDRGILTDDGARMIRENLAKIWRPYCECDDHQIPER